MWIEVDKETLSMSVSYQKTYLNIVNIIKAMKNMGRKHICDEAEEDDVRKKSIKIHFLNSKSNLCMWISRWQDDIDAEIIIKAVNDSLAGDSRAQHKLFLRPNLNSSASALYENLN